MNIRNELERLGPDSSGLYFNDIALDPDRIKAVMINEVVPASPADDFYGGSDAAYLTTAIPLFQRAGTGITSIEEITAMGIYITNAAKAPKTGYAVENDTLERSLPFLEKELSLFPNLKVIMLMGDVAKKAFNRISKKTAGKNAVPAISTYKLRSSELFYHGIRLIPSYIMTGQNLLIEKSKFEMASEDIQLMCRLIR